MPLQAVPQASETPAMEASRKQKPGIVPLLPYVGLPIGASVFWLLGRAHVMAQTPYWVILGLLVGTSALNACAYNISKRMEPGVARTHLRLGVATASTTAILYASGWGPIVAGGYVLCVTDVVRTDGSKIWWRGASWSLGGVLAGQLAIALHWAPTVLPDRVAHAVAFGNSLVVVLILYSFGAISAYAEGAAAEVAQEREHFRSLVQHASDMIAVVDRDMKMLYASPAVEALFGFTPEEIVGTTIGGGVSVDQLQRSQRQLATLNEPGKSVTDEFALHHRDGSARTVELTATLRTDGTIVCNIHDVTAQRALEQRLRFQARHDPLTRLMNRAALLEAVEMHATDGAVAVDTSVLFIDLDGFKAVNDALGHETGDAVLVEAARRISTAIPGHALAGRLGGDEFLVVLPRTRNDDAGVVALRILAALERAWPIPGAHITASIGVASALGGESVEDLVHRADEAMYDAKRRGKGCCVLA
jgi:diguanylate cyclase (GGDEF)-like protein/PAS domain S-box-containing protein